LRYQALPKMLYFGNAKKCNGKNAKKVQSRFFLPKKWNLEHYGKNRFFEEVFLKLFLTFQKWTKINVHFSKPEKTFGTYF